MEQEKDPLWRILKQMQMEIHYDVAIPLHVFIQKTEKH